MATALSRTALITGVAGQDGTYLSRDLLERGYQVHGVVRDVGDLVDPVDDRVAVHRLDLRDSAALREFILEVQPEEIYNLGGQSSVAASWAEPSETIESTGAPIAAVLDAAWQLHEVGHRIAVVQASSAEIFGDAPAPQSETTPIAPESPYGCAKALGHDLVGSYRRRGLHASSMILYNHESPLRPPTFVTRKITRAAARIAQGLEQTLTLGSLDVQRDWGWAPDYVEAMRLAAAQPVADDYVIGTGVSHSVRDFVATAFHSVGLNDWERYVEIDQALVRPVDPVVQLADSRKAREVLRWAPTVHFDELVTRMVEADLVGLET